MKTRIMGWFIYCLAITFGSQAQAGTIGGTVETVSGEPLPGVTLRLEDDEGNEQYTETNENGIYLFSNLEEGWYLIALEEPPDYHLIDPPCGFHRVFLKPNQNLNVSFRLNQTGVVVDFGTPSGNGNGRIQVVFGNQMHFSLYVERIENLGQPAPDRIAIQGYWYLPSGGILDAQLTQGWPVGPYAGTFTDVRHYNLPGNRVSISLYRPNPPHFNLNGEYATFEWSLSSTGVAQIAQSNGQIAFCVEKLSIWSDEELLWVSTDHFVGRVVSKRDDGR